MPRRSTITYDNFFRKAEAVQEIYGRVTYERMREALGSGSMSTYRPFMERWRRERREKTSMGVPRALSERIDIVVRDVYSQISDLAAEDREETVEKARAESAQAKVQLAQRDQELTRTRRQLAASEERVARLEEELRDALRTSAELSRSVSELARRGRG